MDSGWVPPNTRVTELEAAIRAVCEPIFNKPLNDISFGLVLLRLFQTARRFDMQVQPQLVLLQKTLLNIEGLGRQLYPELDLWATAKPVLEKWMAQRTDPRTHLRELLENWPRVAEDLLLVPEAVQQVLRRAAEAGDSPGANLSEPETAVRASGAAGLHMVIAGGALAICGVLWLGLETAPVWPGWSAAGIGVALLFRSAG